jgi:hypothetical protein
VLVDDILVFSAEVKGLRQLANRPRPKVTITSEDVPGALGRNRPGYQDLARPLMPGAIHPSSLLSTHDLPASVGVPTRA